MFSSILLPALDILKAMESLGFGNHPSAAPGNSAYRVTCAPTKPLPPLPQQQNPSPAIYPQLSSSQQFDSQNADSYPSNKPVFSTQPQDQPQISYGTKPLPPLPPDPSTNGLLQYTKPVPPIKVQTNILSASFAPSHNYNSYQPVSGEREFEYVLAERPPIRMQPMPLPSERAVDPGWNIVAPVSSAANLQSITKQVGFVDEQGGYARFGAGPEIALGSPPAVALVTMAPIPTKRHTFLITSSFGML